MSKKFGSVCLQIGPNTELVRLFIHSWMKVKAMAERCEWTGVACCVAEVTA